MSFASLLYQGSLFIGGRYKLSFRPRFRVFIGAGRGAGYNIMSPQVFVRRSISYIQLLYHCLLLTYLMQVCLSHCYLVPDSFGPCPACSTVAKKEIQALNHGFRLL
jgi:hypothetical protein